VRNANEDTEGRSHSKKIRGGVLGSGGVTRKEAETTWVPGTKEAQGNGVTSTDAPGTERKRNGTVIHLLRGAKEVIGEKFGPSS